MTDSLVIKGCRQHNLKDISLKIPKHCIVAFTGVSGSGKTSLAFDTIYAEGQRRFLEYLSPNARRLIRQMPKPEVDLIEGLSPTLAVSQTHRSLTSKSTLAMHTDLFDFLALIYAHIGEQHSPATGKRLTRYTRQEIVDKLLKTYPEGSRLQLLAPMRLGTESVAQAVGRLQKLGFLRLRLGGVEFEVGQHIPEGTGALEVVIDRLQMQEGIRERLTASITTALDLSRGILMVQEGREGAVQYFTEIYLCPDSGLNFVPLRPRDFRSLSPEVLSCLIEQRNIAQLCALSVEALLQVVKGWHWQGRALKVAEEILPEVISRLEFLIQVGLGYLELDRTGETLSEGEAQRVQLAAQIGAKLSGILYVLDEPSRGLHRQDIHHLGGVIRKLKDLGNSVLIVEHDHYLLQLADHLVEIGPGSGIHGGKITFEGQPKMFFNQGEKYLSAPKRRRKATEFLDVRHVTLHNLQDFSCRIPLGLLVGLYGVSGSGKSTLLLDVLAKQQLWSERLVVVEQGAAGISPRSFPATFVGVMTPLRELFAKTKLARARGYGAARFSPNVRGGRCEVCQGLGYNRINMEFMPDLFDTCEICQGKRFNEETLQITWEGLSIADVLALSSEAAAKQFEMIPAIGRPLQLMKELGLDYLTLGQVFNTLSGGEIQRLKLVADLAHQKLQPTLYLMDEPCAGLHINDIAKLAKVLQRLVGQGHSVIAVEHNLDFLTQCDWVLELGPGGGPKGGNLVFEGTPEQLRKAQTPTGRVYQA